MSRIYVPPSQDTLFMRGFSYEHRIEDIKDFFVREAGRCMVEFNKDDGSNGQYVALKFESRDIAKDVYRRFNDRDILGDRVSMTWYKDLRRIKRMNVPRRYHRGSYHGADQYEYRGSYQRSGYQRSHYQRTSSGRMRRCSRSSSRSRSISHSPTRSKSRSRSSSRSYESKDFRKKRSERKKRTKHSKKEGYESSEGKNVEQMKNESSLLDGGDMTDSKIEDKSGFNDSMANEKMDLNDAFETSPKHKMAAVRSLVQKKAEDGNPLISGDKHQLVEKEQTIPGSRADDHQKESSDNDKNILELHPSDDEELEIEDNIDEASPLSLNFSNNLQEQPTNGGSNAQNFGSNRSDKDEPSNLAYKDPAEGEPVPDVYRHTTDKSLVSFDLHVQQRKEIIAGLSFEKLKLMNEKKMEIEKAYRQDCETLVMVTKLLISKDSELEDRIQNSLRENLREIGQRCIQELKEFVEKIRSDEEI